MKLLSETFTIEDLVARYGRLGLRPGVRGWFSKSNSNICCPLGALCVELYEGEIEDAVRTLAEEFSLGEAAFYGFMDGVDDAEQGLEFDSDPLYNDGYNLGCRVRERLQILYGPLPNIGVQPNG